MEMKRDIYDYEPWIATHSHSWTIWNKKHTTTKKIARNNDAKHEIPIAKPINQSYITLEEKIIYNKRKLPDTIENDE